MVKDAFKHPNIGQGAASIRRKAQEGIRLPSMPDRNTAGTCSGRVKRRGGRVAISNNTALDSHIRSRRASIPSPKLMDYISGALAGPPGDKLKLATLAQLVLGCLISYWAIDLASVVAVFGILAVVLSQVELLRLVRAPYSASFLSYY